MTSTGIPGVSLHKPTGKYHARRYSHGKQHSYGYHDTPEQAAQALADADLAASGGVPYTSLEMAVSERLKRPLSATRRLITTLAAAGLTVTFSDAPSVQYDETLGMWHNVVTGKWSPTREGAL